MACKAKTYRYEARYHDSSEWLPIPEWLLRKRLAVDSASVDNIIEAMCDGDEADDEAMVYRAVEIIDESDYEIVLTTAPKDYDGFGTIELSPRVGLDHCDRPLRRVAIRPEHWEWQTLRYGSGLHAVATESEARRFPTIYRLTV